MVSALPPIDNEQSADLGIEPAFDQIVDESLHDSGILVGDLDQAERMLVAFAVDPNAAATRTKIIADVQPVDLDSSYARFWVTRLIRRRGGLRHLGGLNSVLEFDALNDLWQLVLAVQSPPCFRGGVDKFEHHEFSGCSADSAPLVRTVR